MSAEARPFWICFGSTTLRKLPDRPGGPFWPDLTVVRQAREEEEMLECLAGGRNLGRPVRLIRIG
jgi:hypothetical protein